MIKQREKNIILLCLYMFLITNTCYNKSPRGYTSPLWAGMCGRHAWEENKEEKKRRKKKCKNF
jgi:hypothetical protein